MKKDWTRMKTSKTKKNSKKLYLPEFLLDDEYTLIPH